jgi:hypothetical protein
MTEASESFDVDAFLAATDLSSHHRSVVKRLFASPASENIEVRLTRAQPGRGGRPAAQPGLSS